MRFIFHMTPINFCFFFSIKYRRLGKNNFAALRSLLQPRAEWGAGVNFIPSYVYYTGVARV